MTIQWHIALRPQCANSTPSHLHRPRFLRFRSRFRRGVRRDVRCVRHVGARFNAKDGAAEVERVGCTWRRGCGEGA